MRNQNRNIILVAGPFGAGKTHLLNTLRDAVAPVLGLPFEYTPISDAHTITERLVEDDRSGGYHHYHPGNREAALAGNFFHQHTEGFPIYPFTAAGNEIIMGMTKDFLERLESVPRDGHLYFAEWSMGKNMNAPEEPAARAIALSAETIAKFLADSTYPTRGLERVYAVIHPQTKLENRLDNNTSRGVPSQEDYRLGRRSWKIAREGMLITGKDDFEFLAPSLKKLGIPQVLDIFNGYHIEDERYPEMAGEIVRQLTRLLQSWKREIWQGGERGQRRFGEKER